MAPRRYIQYLLTCKDASEADKIATALLKQHLIVCAMQTPVTSKFWFKGKLDKSTEVLLSMDSAYDLWTDVKAMIAELHSYEVFNLRGIPVASVSNEAERWMDENLKPAAVLAPVPEDPAPEAPVVETDEQ